MPRLATVQDSADRLSISVALCTHNGAPFVAQQVRSILEQTVPPDQLILSDDASADETVETVRAEVDRYLEENPGSLEFVVLQNPEPLGVMRNFEQAVRACTGDLIALCDQDDVWMPRRLESVAREFASRPELTLLHGDARLVDSGGIPIGHSLFEAIEFTPAEQREVREGHAYDVLLRRNVVTGATTVFRKGLLNHAIPFFEPWVHDEWLAILASIVGRVDFLPTALVDYRQHDANQIGARRPGLREKLGRLREPRDERNQHLVARAESLLGRLVGLGSVVPPGQLKLARQKLAYERWRRDLPVSRLRRVVPVVRAGLAGKYRTFGRARYDMMRDILQPDR